MVSLFEIVMTAGNSSITNKPHECIRTEVLTSRGIKTSTWAEVCRHCIPSRSQKARGRNFPFSTLYSPLSTFNFQFSTFHFPLSTFHFPLSTFHFPFSTLHFPFSTSKKIIQHLVNQFRSHEIRICKSFSR